jgi:hypothetical protein
MAALLCKRRTIKDTTGYVYIIFEPTVSFLACYRKSGGFKGLSKELMEFRKNPFLFECVEDKISPGGFVDQDLWQTSPFSMCLLSNVL